MNVSALPSARLRAINYSTVARLGTAPSRPQAPPERVFTRPGSLAERFAASRSRPQFIRLLS